MAASAIGPGQVLQGTYRVTRCVAKGGMGIVYEAEHLRLSKRRVAIKVLHPMVRDDPTAYVRFRREAEIVSALGHPHILYVIDFNELEDGQPYMVMEYLEGEDLKTRLSRTRTLRPAEVSRLVEQAGSALQVVHDHGIVHRDLKPSNIFLLASSSGELHIKLFDFGISKVRHSKSVVTREESLIGTPFYMSPEQAKGSVSEIDHRTDIFSLAIITQLCLAGERPFDAPTVPGVLFSICYEPPRPILELDPTLTSRVATVLARAMEKRKEQRYDRMDEYVRELKAALVETDPAARPPDNAVAAAPLDVERTFPPLAVSQISVVEELTQPQVRPRPAAPQVEPEPRVGTTLSRAAAELSLRPPAPPRRLAVVSVVLSTLAALLVGGIVWWLVDRRPEVQPSTTRPSDQALATIAAAPALRLRPVPGPDAAHAPGPDASRASHPQGAPKLVRVRLRLTPPAARVYLDGVVRADNPLVVAPSLESHLLRVEADGYLPRTTNVVISADRALAVRLRRRTRLHPEKLPPPKAKREPTRLYDDI